MGSEEAIGDRVFHQRNGNNSIMNCPSSVMATDSISDHFYSSGWDQSGNYLGNSSSQNEFANPHFPVVMQNQTMVHPFPSDSGLVVPSFGSGSFSEMVIGSFGHMDESGCHSNFHQNQGIGNQKNSINNSNADSQENCQNSEDGVLGAASSPNGKRKRKGSIGASSKNVEVEQQHKDQLGESSEFPKDDEKKNMGANSRGKQAVKQTTENSNGAEASKDTYIHVRAKRGQATNSHSLAERVRREKISERMRLLQELVPGCNKITGKAVMLDEIINYVQSLQQQVEFLSMKLATVNPELNVDIERLLAKDILHPRGSNANALGIGPGLGSSHPFQGLPQGTINGFPGTTPPFHPLPQNLWSNELQNILQMGFNTNPSVGNLEGNGLSKMEL